MRGFSNKNAMIVGSIEIPLDPQIPFVSEDWLAKSPRHHAHSAEGRKGDTRPKAATTFKKDLVNARTSWVTVVRVQRLVSFNRFAAWMHGYPFRAHITVVAVNSSCPK